MKKNLLGAVVFFSLLALAVLSMYIYAARTGSGQRLREFNRTAGFLEERIAALEKQRDLLGETAAALDSQASALKLQSQDLQHRSVELARQVGQIDLEITNMRDLIGGARESARSPLFNIRGFRLTAGSGIVIMAFLAFIWLLYSSLRSRAAEDDAFLGDVGRVDEPEDTAPVPGSLREEEFPAAAPEKEVRPPGSEDAADEDDRPASPAASGGGDGDTEESSPPSVGEDAEAHPDSEVAVEGPDKEGEQ